MNFWNLNLKIISSSEFGSYFVVFVLYCPSAQAVYVNNPIQAQQSRYICMLLCICSDCSHRRHVKCLTQYVTNRYRHAPVTIPNHLQQQKQTCKLYMIHNIQIYWQTYTETYTRLKMRAFESVNGTFGSTKKSKFSYLADLLMAISRAPFNRLFWNFY